MTNDIIKQAETDLRKAQRNSDQKELKYAKLNLGLAKDASNQYRIVSKYQPFFSRLLLEANPRRQQRIGALTFQVLLNLNPNVQGIVGNGADKYKGLKNYESKVTRFLQRTRKMKSKWDTKQRMQKAIGPNVVLHRLEMTDPKHAKLLKKAKRVVKMCKPTLNKKENRKYLFNAMKLSEHYNEYGDFKHPDSEYNERFKPITVKNKAVNNMYWFAYDWYNLVLDIRGIEQGRDTDFLTLNGYVVFTLEHFKSIKTHDYWPTPNTPGTDQSIFKNNK